MTVQKRQINALQAVLDQQATTAAPAAAPSGPPHSARNYNRPSRSGKRLIGGHFPPEVAKHLKILAAEEETSVQALLEEALDLLFVKKGKGHIRRV
jgi:hypothetical protein